jgi:hypothetical protein
MWLCEKKWQHCFWMHKMFSKWPPVHHIACRPCFKCLLSASYLLGNGEHSVQSWILASHNAAFQDMIMKLEQCFYIKIAVACGLQEAYMTKILNCTKLLHIRSLLPGLDTQTQSTFRKTKHWMRKFNF